MNPPSPSAPESGVWFPLPFAMKLLDCYFGSAPRRSEEQTAMRAPPPLPPEGDFLPKDAHLYNSANEWKPKGYAERRASAAAKSGKIPVGPAAPTNPEDASGTVSG